MKNWLRPLGGVVIATLIWAGFFLPHAGAAQLNLESIALSTPALNATGVTYTMTVSNQSTTTIRCMRLRFTDTLGVNSLPVGMDISGAALSAASTIVPTPGAWAATGLNGTGIVTMLNAAGEAPVGGAGRTVVLTGMENGSTGNTTYYAELTTYSDVACTTTVDDDGVALFVFTSGVLITSVVVDALSFSITPSCSAGNLVPTAASTCTLEMHAATNHVTGYTISYGPATTLQHSQLGGEATVAPTSASGQPSNPGTQQFGFNLVANTNPSVGANPAGGLGTVIAPYDTPNQFAFATAGDALAETTGMSADTQYIISYLINTTPNMFSGNYVSNQTFTIVVNP